MTYKVSSGTLNLCSLTHSRVSGIKNFQMRALRMRIVLLHEVLRNQMTPLIIDSQVVLFRNILTPC